ncbi:hypothetical protein GCM10023189_18890 [Nibrella saemangeumensis]|uniref:FecR family protein n=1 Tax=Nibrella saemangeumensis TaxID=1084526 RepID=A0ABP8MNK8_9BACT
MKSLDYYASLTADDLAAEPAFRVWVLSPTPALNLFWESVKAINPVGIERARLLVYGLEMAWDEMPEEAADASYTRLRERLSEQPPTVRPLSATRPWFYRYSSVAAAVVVLLLAGVGGWLLSRPPETLTYQTAYGKIQTVTLPDGSVVTLNGNSTLRLTDNWAAQGRREVNLTGEAFFEVNKQPNGQRMTFIVHTSTMDVVVLGTRFSVATRRKKTQVVLQEGKVKLQLDRQPDIVMRPGDLVEASAGQQTIRHTRVNADRYIAWRANQLIFDDEPLRTIIQRMQDLYGLQISVTDSSLLDERFTGVTPTDQPDLLVRLLAETFKCQVTRQGNDIVFTPITK